MIKILALLVTFFSFVFSNNLTEPQTIYLKKCQMCHALDYPDSVEEKNASAAPNILTVMKNISKGIDAIEEPKTKEELKILVVEFMKDYIYNPSPKKSYCEDSVFKRYDYMPSLKGFISEDELDIVLPWVYDNFIPKEK